MSHFKPLEFVDRGSETQTQVFLLVIVGFNFRKSAKKTNSRIPKSCENYYYSSASKEKRKFASSKLREKSQNQKFRKFKHAKIIRSTVIHIFIHLKLCLATGGGGPRVVVSTAALYARVRGSVPGLGGFKETKMFLPHPRVKVSIVGSLRDREVACSASDRQGSNFESCVWRTVSSQSSHNPQEVLLAQFSLYVHKGGLKPDSFHFHFVSLPRPTTSSG